MTCEEQTASDLHETASDLKNGARTCAQPRTKSAQRRSQAVPVYGPVEPPWEKRAREARLAIRHHAELRGYKVYPVGVRMTPLDHDLAREEDCPDHKVYFLYGAGRIKIGFTAGEPLRREDNLGNQSPVHLDLVKIIPGGKVTEFRMHHRFRTDRLYGEWFRLSPALRSFIVSTPGSAARLEQVEDSYRRWLETELSHMKGERPMTLRLLDHTGQPTPHTSNSSQELVEIAKSMWPNQEPNTSDDDMPNGWSIQVDGFKPPVQV